MTSIRKTVANRRNATRSTGPKTSAGRSRSSRNAIRHGLERAHFKEQDNPELVDRIVEAICSGDADPSCRLLARVIAEQHIFLTRVRAARVTALEHIFEQLAKTASAKPSASSDGGEEDAVGVTDNAPQKENGNENAERIIVQAKRIFEQLEKTESAKPSASSDSGEKDAESATGNAGQKENGNQDEDRIIREAFISIICISEEFQSRIDTLLQGNAFQTAIKTVNGTSSLLAALNRLKAAQGKELPELKRVSLREKVVRLTKSLNDVLDPPRPEVSSLDRAWAQLVGLERYEHRALSKRRRAMRRLAELHN
jgi:hypothetical protein